MTSKIPLDVPRERGDRYAGLTILMQTFADRLLNSEVGAEVQERLNKGWSAEYVADFVHDQGEMQELSHSALCRVICAIRESMSPVEQVQPVSSAVKRAVNFVDHGIDVLGELRDLYAIQRERIDIAFRIERANRSLLPTTHREVKTAMDLLSNYAKVQMDFGLVKRQLGTLEVEETERIGMIPGCTGKVQEALADPQRRRRLMSVLHRVAAIEAKDVEDRTITVEPESSSSGDDE